MDSFFFSSLAPGQNRPNDIQGQDKTDKNIIILKNILLINFLGFINRPKVTVCNSKSAPYQGKNIEDICRLP